MRDRMRWGKYTNSLTYFRFVAKSAPEVTTMSDMQPKQPPCEGPQFAVNPYASDNYLNVSYDAFDNEIAEDRPMHENTTAGNGSFNFGGKQYSEDWQGGNRAYGVSVGTPSPSRETTDVNVHSADRGSES